MIQEVLKSIESVAIFPLLGLFLCLGGFLVILITTWRMRPDEVEHASRLPLDSPSGELGAPTPVDTAREIGRTKL